jgi:hypothetical protein
MNRMRALVGIILAIVLVVLGGWLALRGDRTGSLASQSGDVVAAKEKHEGWLMDLRGVVGVGIGDCDARPCIKVYMSQHVAESERRIPKELDGFKTDVLVTGPIQPQSR